MKISNIKKQISKIVSHPLFNGSIIMVLGTNLFNVGQFIYHILAGRFLGKVFYGDVAGIISILGFVGIVQISAGLTIVKFLASQRDKNKSANFIKWIDMWSLWIGAGIGVLALLTAPLLIRFMKISEPVAVYLLGPILLFFVITNAGRSILQGIMRFDKYVGSFLAEIVVKLLFTFILVVWLGLKVAGAIGSLFVSILIGFLITRMALAIYLKGPRGPKPQMTPLLAYSLPALLQGIALTSMYSTDLILVKHFFAPEEAGLYASMAVLGRIVFFAASPVTNVMFPLVARRYSHGMAYHNIFFVSLFLVVGVSAMVVFLFRIFPKIFILPFGQEFIEGAPILWWFGVFMGLLALGMLLTQFYLSIGKTRVVWLFVLAAVLQIILIWFIHPNLLTVIQLSIVSAALLVFALIIYFPYHHKP